MNRANGCAIFMRFVQSRMEVVSALRREFGPIEAESLADSSSEVHQGVGKRIRFEGFVRTQISVEARTVFFFCAAQNQLSDNRL